jgi:hypothetical protein
MDVLTVYRLMSRKKGAATCTWEKFAQSLHIWRKEKEKPVLNTQVMEDGWEKGN